MPRQKLLHVALGAIIALALLAPLGAFAFVKSGIYNVGASRRHTKFTEWITHETMIHSVRRHAEGISPPVWTSAQQVVAGYCAYEAHCVSCHGGAAVARQQWVNGLEPQPPYLLDATREFTPPQLFWIARNGIKMTGMPAWDESMSDRQIWNVVAWIEASKDLPPQTYVRWRADRRCGPIPSPLPAPSPIPRP